MKRSEMVTKLVESLLKNMNKTDNMESLASFILMDLNELGMAPPKVEGKVGRGFYDIHEWEKEDEDYCGAV